MAKKAKKKAKNKGGRPTKYKPEFVQIAGELCQEEGYTDKNLAVHFKVDEATINRWKKRYCTFCEAIKKGKDEHDSRVVEQALLKRAVGYRYDEITQEPVVVVKNRVEVSEEDGSEQDITKFISNSIETTKIVTKEIAPSEVAIIFWLKNRQPQRWSDKKEIDHRVEGITETLTMDEMKRRIAESEAAGDGIDHKSIEGNGNNNNTNSD